MMGNMAEAAGRHCEEPTDLGCTRDRQILMRKSGGPGLRGRRSNLMPRVRDCFASLAMTTFAFVSATAAAQEPDASTFPNRPIHIVVPFPAGGPADLVSRLIGQKMTEAWGQPVIIDNRPGANTIIGAQAVARAAPDGYMLLMAIDSTLVMNQFMHKSLPYDPFNDFAPITLTTKTVSVLAVRADGPRTVAELIARARKDPGKLNFGGGTLTAQLMGHL